MYPNGEVPLSKLIHVSGNIWLPPGTLARVNWAIEQAHAKYGVRLRITGQGSSAWNTWNGYRPRLAQVKYRAAYGIMAAVPGTSSHGGTYRGQEVFAADFDNWAELGWARFAAIMRLAGLTVDFVSPREQWHVGDFNNVWAVPTFASGGGGSALNPGSKTTLKRPVLGDNMIPLYITDDCDGNGRPGWALFNEDTGKWVPQINDGSAKAQEIANSWGRVLGRNANYCSRQDVLNVAAGIRATA